MYFTSHRLILQIIVLWFLTSSSILHAQTYPPYAATVFDSSANGYYFTIPIKIGLAGANYNPCQMILDKNGEVVYYKLFTTGNTGDFKLHPNGIISYSYANKFYLMDSTFTIIDSVRCKNGVMQDGHDIQILPNGNFLLLGLENITMNLSSYNWFNQNGSPGSATATVRCGVIQEQDANKNVVFEWHAKDYFLFSDVDTTRLNNPANVDWTHFNAVEQDLDGNILVSARHFNEITKINRSTGAVMWRLGGKANQFNFVNDTDMFLGQHDCRRISNGNITLYDNGSNGPPFHSATAKEYQLDEINLTANLVWSYVNLASEYSSAMGNVQRNSNGNTLINYGVTDNVNTIFNVVKPNGAKVFELVFADSAIAYRSFNYATLPWNLNRPEIICSEVAGQFYLTAPPGFTSYSWSNGATTSTIAITALGNYAVFVPKGNGGFIRSENFVVSSLTNPCSVLNVSTVINSQSAFSIFPNPVENQLHLNFAKETAATLCVKIYTANGNEVYSSCTIYKNYLTISLEHLPAGLYYLLVNGKGQKFMKQ